MAAGGGLRAAGRGLEACRWMATEQDRCAALTDTKISL